MIYDVDESAFREMPDHQACVLLWNGIDGPRTRVVMNPNAVDALAAIEVWLADLLERVTTHGLERAAEIDGWQLRSDGAYQKWVRAVELEDPFPD